MPNLSLPQWAGVILASWCGLSVVATAIWYALTRRPQTTRPFPWEDDDKEL